MSARKPSKRTGNVLKTVASYYWCPGSLTQTLNNPLLRRSFTTNTHRGVRCQPDFLLDAEVHRCPYLPTSKQDAPLDPLGGPDVWVPRKSPSDVKKGTPPAFSAEWNVVFWGEWYRRRILPHCPLKGDLFQWYNGIYYQVDDHRRQITMFQINKIKRFWVHWLF